MIKNLYFRQVHILVLIFICIGLASFHSSDDKFKCISHKKWRIDKIYLDSAEIKQPEMESLFITFKKSGVMILTYNNENISSTYSYKPDTRKITLNFPDNISLELDVLIAEPYCLVLSKPIKDSNMNALVEYRFKLCK